MVPSVHVPYFDVHDNSFVSGPIIRINPKELHVQDPEYFETIYSQGNDIDKVEWQRFMFSIPSSIGSTIEHNAHRTRKAPLLSFFSKASVQKQAPNIVARLERMLNRLREEFAGSGKPINLCDLFSCFAADIITQYSFGKSYDFLGDPDFICPFSTAVAGFKKAGQISIQFPVVPRLLRKIPDQWVSVFRPSFVPVAAFKKEVFELIEAEKARKAKGITKHSPESIFSELLDSDLPPQDLESHRLMEEGVAVIGAAIDTTKWSIVVTIFHILQNPNILNTLRRELAEANPDASLIPPLTTLERLPYFMACIEEGIRLSYGGFVRSPRRHPKPLFYQSRMIPARTPISTDAWTMHHDENIFPDSFTFRPERWLNDPRSPSGKSLSRYILAFGKGTRACLGMQLAYAEMELSLAALFQQFDLELFETSRKDVDVYCDALGPAPHPESKAPRVLIRLRSD
ncbi:MAG: hypothetical protein M1822_002356 [Bathelium mastoideum]|nr:MAG: hypothetical protein M1822_002356 [Bathelium mastoideum]